MPAILAAPLLGPPAAATVAAIGKGVLWLGATVGAVVVANEANEALESRNQTKDVVAPCQSCTKTKCPPCVPTVGTLGMRVDRVPPSAPHYPCSGDHGHIYRRGQNPKHCRCFWSNTKKVDCLTQGAPMPPGFFPLTRVKDGR